MSTNNAWFSGLLTILAEITADLDDLEAGEATAHGRAKGAASARDDKKKKVIDDLGMLACDVQGIVNQHPGEAATIIASAGMFEKMRSARSKPELAASMGPVPGLVIVRARAVKGAAYEWRCSTDGGVTWIAMGLTTVANTSIAGIARGTTCLFGFRTTRGSVTGGWSQTISFYAT